MRHWTRNSEMGEVMHKDYPKIGERVYSEKLPNGLSVFVVPKHGFYKNFAYFATDYGGIDRRFNLSGNWINTPEGVAHFLEHEMFDMEYGNALTKLSANGANPNAYTSSDITAYYFECADDFSDNFRTLLDFVSKPYFSPESVEKEQGIIGQEILMCEDDPDYCVYYNLMKSLFRQNPLRDSVAGTVESISKITPETLYDCHKVFYNPSNMALCVAGDAEIQEIIDIAQNILPGEPGEIPLRDYGYTEELKPEAPSIRKAMEVSQPIFLAGCKSTPATKGLDTLRLDLISALALDILAGHSSSLYIRLYSEGLICGDFSASFESAAGTAYSMFGGESADPERVFNEVRKEISALSDSGPDKDLFNRIKKAAIGSQIRSLNSLEAICASIVGGYFRGYDAFIASELLESITDSDITEFFREHLAPENMAISIVAPLSFEF